MSTSAKLVAALLLLYFLMTRCQTFDLDRIIPVWKALGWKDVTLVSANGSWPRQGPDLARRASAEGMSLSILVGQDPFHRALREEREARGDLFVRTYFVFADAVDLFPAVRECLLQFRRVYSVMVLALEAGLPEVDELVRSLDFASGFFRATVREDDGAVSLARIQTFLRGESYVDDEWELDGGGHRYVRSYDMQGHLVATVALTWEPWLVLDADCPPPQTDCGSWGILTDIMDSMAGTFNYTWSVAKQSEEDWGVTPKDTGDGLQAHDYVGVLGDVVNRRYDICLSVWRLIYERTLFADYTTPVANLPRILMVDGGKIGLDMTLFFRPFTPKSWLAIIGFVAIGCLCLLFVPKFYQLLLDQVSMAGRIVTLSAWMFFLLVNTYYGGALTMFFSSPPSQPFETLRDGLMKHPTWDLVMQRSTEAHIINRANDGDPPYADWKRRQEEEGGLLFNTMRETLTKLTEGGYFTDVELAQVASYLHDNPIPGLTPAQVGHKWSVPAMMITSRNSPVTVMLDRGLQRLRQTGLGELMMVRYILRLPGTSEDASGISHMSLEQMSLEGRHTAAVFFGAVMLGCVVVAVFASEVIFHWIIRRKVRKD